MQCRQSTDFISEINLSLLSNGIGSSYILFHQQTVWWKGS
jgi:hypothetical protein